MKSLPVSQFYLKNLHFYHAIRMLGGNGLVELLLTNKRHPCPPTPHPPLDIEVFSLFALLLCCIHISFSSSVVVLEAPEVLEVAEAPEAPEVLEVAEGVEAPRAPDVPRGS